MITYLKQKVTEPTAWLAVILFLLVIVTGTDTIPVWALILTFFVPQEWLQEQVDRMTPTIHGWLDQLTKGDEHENIN